MDEGALPLLRLSRDRLRRLPLPGHGDHWRSVQHRPSLRAFALSWRDGAACPRGGCQAAEAVYLSQSAQRRRGREGRGAPAGACGISVHSLPSGKGLRRLHGEDDEMSAAAPLLRIHSGSRLGGMLITVAASLALALAATAPSIAAGHGDTCGEISETDAAKLQNRAAVLADIDGVLSQYVLLDYGPTNAALMMNIYLRRGYLIVYMAGRPRQMDVLGKSMCRATLDWLEANGFPTDPGDTLLLLRDGSQA